MMLKVANPIYDAVFKYLMEDERVAKTLLSALLKKDVVQVEVRPHEYSNKTEDNRISMFRIDFAATVREQDGTEHLVLVELQKTWVETETLRFRRYLAVQYNNEHNMRREEGKEDFAIPMVAVYLLGHRVGDIEEPVLYCNHKSYDYNGKEITKGIPNPFIESLTHDSIVVQIPLLHGQVNNRLDEVLSVFDQTKTTTYNKQLLYLDENEYADDEDMKYIVRRLTAAAANGKMREDMDVEDEYYSVIARRDTALMNRDKRIAELDLTIATHEQTIATHEQTIATQDLTIATQEQTIAEKEQTIAEQQKMLGGMIHSMLERGMSVSDIAQLMGKTIEEINEML